MSSPPNWETPAPALTSHPTVSEIETTFRGVQDTICNWLTSLTGEEYLQDEWDYDKGSGGGVTRVWENGSVLAKAGVNWSGIAGPNLPPSAQKAFNIDDGTPYSATGVSLVIHPVNPWVPTVHMNVRYFAAGDKLWWFGGGIDVTPYYPDIDAVVAFHAGLKDVYDRHGRDYGPDKTKCDEYFFLPHRDETRGVGGVFFDHLNADAGMEKRDILAFVADLGAAFVDLYGIFLTKDSIARPYSDPMVDFQLYRRGRYVEFNLLFDRGTKFGIQSNGRTESILMSLPAEVHWKYNWSPSPGSVEELFYTHYLHAQPWLDLSDEDKEGMRLPSPME